MRFVIYEMLNISMVFAILVMMLTMVDIVVFYDNWLQMMVGIDMVVLCRIFEMNLVLIKNRLVINLIIVMIVIFSLAIVMAI